MKRFYRTLSVLLALLLTVSLVGPAAFAQENAPASQPNAGTAPVCAQLEGCENGEHNVQCPLYVSNENTAAQKVIELLSNLPTAEQVQSYVPVLSLPQEDAGYQQAYTEAVQAYQNTVKEQMSEASAAYGALAEQEKQLVSADLLSKLSN